MLGMMGAALALATGCGLAEERFYDKLGKVGCKKAFECDSEVASDTWGNEDACEAAFGEEASEARKVYRACKYRRKKARKYLRAYKKLDCSASDSDLDDLDDRWSDVYECEGGGDGETGDTGVSF